MEGERAAVAAELARVKAEAATLHQVLKSMKGGVRRDDSSFTLGYDRQTGTAHYSRERCVIANMHGLCCSLACWRERSARALWSCAQTGHSKHV